MPMKDCKFCDKQGLLILPLRYAAVVGEKGAKGLPELPGTLGAKVKDLKLTHGKYAPRLLRKGYLYVLIERLGIKFWECYLVTEDAFLYKFPENEPPTVPVDFSCDQSTCGIDASCVSIKDADKVKKAYFLFSPSPLTKVKRDEYKTKADEFVGLGKMQLFNPAAWVAKSRKQEHSLTPELLDEHVPEWLLYKQGAEALVSALGVELKRQSFPAIGAAYAGVKTEPGKPAPGRLGVLQDKLVRTEGAAFALFDHIGITQELNDYRNAPLEGIQYYLAATDEYGASNQQRLEVYEAIQELKAGIQTGVIQDSQDFIARHQVGSDQFFENQRRTAQRLRGMGREADAQSIEASVEESLRERQKNYEKALADSKVLASQRWTNKYESRLDLAEMELFNKTLSGHLNRAEAQTSARHPQHLQWFESDRLVNAFDLFDPNHLPAGLEFAHQSALCSMGMAGCKEAEPKLDEWIRANSVERKNLYMRGVYFNQAELFAAARQAYAEIKAAVAKEESASSLAPAFVIKITKGLVDGFKKSDSAVDEWVRNRSQPFSKKWTDSPELVQFHKMMDMTRSVFRAGLGGRFDKELTACISAVMFSKLRALSSEVAYNEVMLTLPKAKLDALKRARAEQRRAANASAKASKVASQVDDSMLALVDDAKAKARKRPPTLAQLKDEKFQAPINNYHQVRLGVALGCIEMLALGEKLSHFEPGTKGYLEVGGSAAAVGSIVMDLFYASAKSVREIEPYKSIKAISASADVMRGWYKLGAGVLGAAAGFCAATLDFMKFSEARSTGGKTFYFVRASVGAIGTGLGAAAAFSYSGPALAHVAKKLPTSSWRRLLVKGSAELATKLAARVRLLVWVARFNWVGLGLTLAEVGYLAIRDNELQNWCEQSVFRKTKVSTNWLGTPTRENHFESSARELEELERSKQAVGLAG